MNDYICFMKQLSLYVMIAAYIFAGVNHFINPALYISIMPPWLPWHRELVILSGICEILFAVLMIFPSTRRLGAWCIILLLLAVFPANIQMMINFIREDNKDLWISVIRLPVQILLIWWAYIFTKKVSVRS